MTFVELADDLGSPAPLKLKWVGNTISGPQDIQTVIPGDVDIGGAFLWRHHQADRGESADQGGGRLFRLGRQHPYRLLCEGGQTGQDRARSERRLMRWKTPAV